MFLKLYLKMGFLTPSRVCKATCLPLGYDYLVKRNYNPHGDVGREWGEGGEAK